MRIPLFHVDAFAERPFAGNPAAVCPLEAWLSADQMQAIAAENNLSETAFFVKRADGDFDLRWFTPLIEVDLCGHATLASALVIFERLEASRERVRFHTRSGPLDVERHGAKIALDLPARTPRPCAEPQGIAEALGAAPVETCLAGDLVCVYASAEDVRALAPDMTRVAALGARAVIVTARGSGADADVDFVSRFFAPGEGIPEDPVTGSAHAKLVPFWAQRLGRTQLRARQVSKRTGELACERRGERVRLVGSGVLVIEGTMML